MSHPDTKRSIESYARLAIGYDATCKWTAGVRNETVALLHLRKGETVLDVASGTGLSFPLLMEAVGFGGRIVAVEHSPEMMALARERVAASGWRNVTLIEAAAKAADIPCTFDAVLFHYAHDVLQSPTALAHLLSRAKPGARVAVAGAKFAPRWFAPLNLWVMFRAKPYLTTFEGLDEPWRHLSGFVRDLSVSHRMLGTGYIAHGRLDERSGDVH